MADLFDRFTGSAGALTGHTADSGDTWSDPGATDSLDGAGSIYTSGTVTDGALPVSSWTPPGADYAVAFTVGGDVASIAEFQSVGAALRLTGSSGSQSYYFIQLVNYVALVGNWRIEIYLYDGSTHQLASYDLPSPPAASDVVGLSVSGTTLAASYNGTTAATATDGTLTGAGSLGLRCNAPPPSGGHTDMMRALWAGAIGGPSASVSPGSASVAYGGTRAFSGSGALPNESFAWTPGAGSVSPGTGNSTTYTAPGSGSSTTLLWQSADLPTHSASAAINFTGGTSSWVPQIMFDFRPALDSQPPMDVDAVPRSLATPGKGFAFAPAVPGSIIAAFRVPSSVTLATGMTLSLLLSDQPPDGDPGRAAVFGVTLGPVSGTSTFSETDLAGSTEVTGTVTMPEFFGTLTVLEIAVPTASMNGLATNDWAILRIRRLGQSSGDTHRRRVILRSTDARDT